MVVGLIAGARSPRWLTLAQYLANSLAKCAGQNSCAGGLVWPIWLCSGLRRVVGASPRAVALKATTSLWMMHVSYIWLSPNHCV